MQDRLAQAGSTSELYVDLGRCPVDDVKATADGVYDAYLFLKRWEGHRDALHLGNA